MPPPHDTSTSSSGQNNANITILCMLGDDDDGGDSEYRFLVDGKHVKYVTIGPGVFPVDMLVFEPILIPSLPPFPPGDWNEGYIDKDTVTGQPVFTRTARNDNLPGVRNVWHPVLVDHVELKLVTDARGYDDSRIRQNVRRVTHPTLFGGPDRIVVAKFAEFPWQMRYYEDETTAYEWIQGTGIGPEFLGHITEEGRIIGFVLEYIDNAREAGPEDLSACQHLLARLHDMGIRHGDINRYNFMVQGTNARLVDFENARKGCSAEALAKETESLASFLHDKSGVGGPRLLMVDDEQGSSNGSK